MPVGLKKNLIGVVPYVYAYSNKLLKETRKDNYDLFVHFIFTNRHTFSIINSLEWLMCTHMYMSEWNYCFVIDNKFIETLKYLILNNFPKKSWIECNK